MCLRQGLVAYGLGAGLIASALAAAVVGSLVAAGVSRLTNIKVDFPVDEIDHIDIDLPGTLLGYEEAQEVSEKEEITYLKKNTKKTIRKIMRNSNAIIVRENLTKNGN